MRPASRLFRALQRLFPAEFRAEFGGEMDETFAAERAEAAAAGGGAPVRLWLRTLGGALRTAPREHWDVLRRDAAVALRGLRRRPGFTVAAVVTLGLGLGANAAVLAVLDAVVFRSAPFPHPEQLVTVRERSTAGSPSNTTYATYLDLVARSRTLAAATVIGDGIASAAGDAGGEAELLRGMRVTHTFFHTLGIEPQIGRGFLPEEDRPGADRVVVLSYELWQRRFGGDRGVVGREVSLAGRPMRVAGVLPPGAPSTLSRAFYGQSLDYLSALRYDASVPSACRTCRHLTMVARVKPGIDPRAAAVELDGLVDALAAEHPKDYPAPGALVEPLQKALVGEARRPLLALWAAVGCVLLIAASNVAGLLLARGAERGQELSLRAALGAGRGRLFRQLATESLVLAALGGGLATLIAGGIVRWAVLSGAPGLQRLDAARLDLRTLLLMAGGAAALALLMTVAPAWRALRTDLRTALEQRATAGRALQRGRGLLVVAQVALAMVLLVGGGLLLGSLRRLLAQDPGLDPRHVLTAELTLLTPRYDEVPPSVAYVDEAVARARALPGVESAGALHLMPLAGEVDSYGTHLEDRPLANDALAPESLLYRATPGVAQALRLRLLAGRFFDARDRADSEPVAVMGESAARQLWGWPRVDPIGRRVQFGERKDDWRRVVGIVGDLRHDGLGAAAPLQAYVPFAQDSPFRIVLVMRTAGDPARLAGALRRTLAALDPDVPVRQVRPMEEVIGDTLRARRLALLLVGGFAALALILAAVGLYGLLAYTVTLRARELGVRQALGAGRRELVGLVLRQGVGRAAVGVAIGVPAAVLAGRTLRSLLFEVRPGDPMTLALVAAVLLAVAAAASWVPARRAARVDAARVLRGE